MSYDSLRYRRRCIYCGINHGRDVRTGLMRRHYHNGVLCQGSEILFQQHMQSEPVRIPVVFGPKSANDTHVDVNIDGLRAAYMTGYREHTGTPFNSEFMVSFLINQPEVERCCRIAGRQVAAHGASHEEALEAMTVRFNPFRIEISFRSLLAKQRA